MQCAEQPPGGKYNATVISLSLSLCLTHTGEVWFFTKSEKSICQPNRELSSVSLQSVLFVLCVKVCSLLDLFFVNMDSAFDNLDAAGFLEIWQHFDADGENSQ